MIIFLIAHLFIGWKTEKKELADEGQGMLDYGQCIQNGHFIQTTFENWESKFLQMMFYVLFTVKFRQKSYSESKSLDDKDGVHKELVVHLICFGYQKWRDLFKYLPPFTFCCFYIFIPN